MLAPRTIRSGRQIVRFVADRRPTHAAIDPHGLYIDSDLDDDTAPVTG